MATKKTRAGEDVGLERQIGVRLTPEDYARLERLVERFAVGGFTVSSLARSALLVGLDVVESQPTVLLGEKPKKR